MVSSDCQDVRAAVLADEVFAELARLKAEIEQAEREDYLASRPALAQKAIRGDYAAFVQWAWHIIEPGRLLRWGRHLDVICTALQRQMEGHPRYQRLLLVLPPGTGKSIVVAGCREPFQWLTKPWKRTVYLSRSPKLAARDSRRARNIIKHPEYQELVRQAAELHGGDAWMLAKDQDEKRDFQNTAHGQRLSLGIGEGITGERGDDLIMDDLLDAKAAIQGTPERIQRKMDEVNDIIGEVLGSRVNDKRTACQTLMMQRLDPKDPAGRIIAAGGWKTIVLPMEYDPELPPECGGPCLEDWRTKPGEVLFPDLFPPDVIARDKEPPPNGMGQVQYNGQYNCKPSRKESGKYDPEWFRHVYPLSPREQRKHVDQVIISVDATFKKQTSGDSRVSILVWGRKLHPHRHFLLDEINGKMGYVETREAIKRKALSWAADMVLIEEKANGAALLDDLKGFLPIPLVPMVPTVSKEEREELYNRPALMAEDVLMPDAIYCNWVGDFIDEFVDLTPANDRRDAMSQYICYCNDPPEQSAEEWMAEQFGWLGALGR